VATMKNCHFFLRDKKEKRLYIGMEEYFCSLLKTENVSRETFSV
jgi:hypothetical protein